MTIKQIHELLQIIRNQHNLTIVRNLGVEYLLPQEIELLFKSGIDVNKIKTKDLVKNMFYMGLISDVLGRQSKSLTFAELKKHISNPREILPFTQRENIVIDSIKNQFLGDIRANEGRIFRDVNNIITQGQQNNRQSYEQVIRDEVLRGAIDKKATSQIASDLGHKTGDWSRDFSRIIGFISHKAFDEGRASLYERKGGKDIEVYKDVFEGACFPIEDTEFLTNEGFKLLDDIRGDELVATFNKETGEMEYSKILSKIRYYYQGEMHQYKAQNCDLLMTPNHNLLVGSSWYGREKYDLIPSEKYIEKYKFRDWIPTSCEKWSGYNNPTITVCGREFDTISFCKFMAWWLSDGHISFKRKRNRGGSTSTQLCVSQTEKGHMDKVVSVFKTTFPEKNIYVRGNGVSILLKESEDDLSKWFLNFGKAQDKFIPKEILNMDRKYLNYFLEEYLFGDGCISDGRKRFYTSSPRLADDLCEVVLKCGYRPHLGIRDTRGSVTYKKDGSRIETKFIRYVISANIKTKIKNLPLKFKKISNFNGLVGCLEVEINSTLYVRRNRVSSWVGNCKHCIRLYTTNGIGSKPKIFKLSELQGNGTNIGRKSAEWLAVVGSTHLNCRCTLNEVPQGFEWNEKTKAFDIPIERKEEDKPNRQPIRMIFNGKEYSV